jgi:hypothetical protein
MRQQQQQAAASRLVKSNVDLTHRCFDPVPLQLVPTRYGLNASSADCSASWHVRIEPGWVGWPSYLNDTVNWLDFCGSLFVNRAPVFFFFFSFFFLAKNCQISPKIRSRPLVSLVFFFFKLIYYFYLFLFIFKIFFAYNLLGLHTPLPNHIHGWKIFCLHSNGWMLLFR